MPTKQERQRAVKLYTETRLPVGEIAAHLGVSRATIHRWLGAAGVDKRGPMGPRKGFVEPDDDKTAPTTPALLEQLVANRAMLEAQARQIADLTAAVSRLTGALEQHMKGTETYMDEAKAWFRKH